MKKSTKTTLIIVALAMAVTMLLGFATSGFTNWNKDDMQAQFEKQVNPDNLYTVDSILDAFEGNLNDGNGITFKIDEKTGVITANGTAQTDYTVELSTVAVDKGTYTFTALDNPTKGTIYVSCSYGSATWNCDFSGNTQSFDSNTEVTLTINIAKGTKLSNVEILPVIIPGEVAGDFYK